MIDETVEFLIAVAEMSPEDAVKKELDTRSVVLTPEDYNLVALLNTVHKHTNTRKLSEHGLRILSRLHTALTEFDDIDTAV